MYDSNYYLSQMNYYDNKIKKAEKDKENFSKLIANLKSLESNISNVKNDLKDAENSFLSGGYIDNGETFDKGKINECCINLSDISSNIGNVLVKSTKKIIELENEIKEFKRQYELASVNYNNACLEEKSE